MARSRASTTPNLLTRRYPLALLYLDFRQVEVEREQSLPVIEYHAISFKVQGARQQTIPALAAETGVPVGRHSPVPGACFELCR